METIVVWFFISIASFNLGVNTAIDENRATALQQQYRVQYVQESSQKALQDVEDAVNANFSKVRGNKTIENIITRWKDELKK
jgi:hypothetical protein